MAFRFDKFTIKAQESVQRAVDLAADRGNPQTTPVHLLSALVAEQEGIVRPLLEKIGVERGRKTKSDLKVGICGEHGGEPNSIDFFEQCGLDYVSCSPYRVPVARLAAARAKLGEGGRS